MPLPGSGNIDQLAINTEFGAPASTPLTSMVRGGAYVPDTPANAGVPTAAPIGMTDFYGASAAPAVTVNVTNHTVQGYELAEPNPSPPPAFTYEYGYAEIKVRNNGQLQAYGTNGGTNTTYGGEWLTSGAAADVDVRATIISGGLDSGTTGSWLNCNVDRSWTVGNAGPGTASAVVRLEFRNASTLAVLDTCDITLQASRS